MKSQEEKIGAKKNSFDEDSNKGGKNKEKTQVETKFLQENENICEENTDVEKAQVIRKNTCEEKNLRLKSTEFISEFPDIKMKYDQDNLRSLIKKFISNITVVNSYPDEVSAFYHCVINQNYLLF